MVSLEDFKALELRVKELEALLGVSHSVDPNDGYEYYPEPDEYVPDDEPEVVGEYKFIDSDEKPKPESKLGVETVAMMERMLHDPHPLDRTFKSAKEMIKVFNLDPVIFLSFICWREMNGYETTYSLGLLEDYQIYLNNNKEKYRLF